MVKTVFFKCVLFFLRCSMKWILQSALAVRHVGDYTEVKSLKGDRAGGGGGGRLTGGIFLVKCCRRESVRSDSAV